MSDATAARETFVSGFYHVEAYPMASSVTILKGCLVNLSATHYAQHASDTASEMCIGIAHETKTNTGADGADFIQVRHGADEDLVLTHAVGNVDLTVYVLDNQTVGLAAATNNDIPVGRCKGQGITGTTHSRIHVEPALAIA